ncbi:MAG: tRNA (guanosine(46)-N7)-methyltransferase TrmB [bacterium]|nr:tRNA (guanosine(46)-N7)-methyltransferase TrmB [bacterium]MDN5835449.1 tRNA (guanosine(46)-N7)-methyltransferase TrmB [bacterium]
MKDKLDPNDFMITRKRKKYKFAKFHNAENCFEIEEWQKDGIKAVDVVEIGAGDGKFSLELAAKYPDKTFVALDIKGDRLQNGAYEALGRGVKNVFFVRARADQVGELFAEKSLKEVWVTFPDPFPRAKSSGRRLTNSTFLRRYQELLASSGCLSLKHDNDAFFNWSLTQLVAEKWRITELIFDLHDKAIDETIDARVDTTYEKRWLDDGRTTKYVRAVRD